MTQSIRRVALGVVLGGASLAAITTGSAPAFAQTCDPSYPDFCIQPPFEVGDLDCADIIGSGFTVLPPDPHLLDVDGDRRGC